MPLSPPVSRQLRHRRAIRAEAHERADGLWDVEACLTDEKPRDVVLASGVRPKGQPIHELWLRITIDRKLNVVDAEASSDWVPYPGLCQASNPAYRALIGLNLFQNFRSDAARLLAGTAGCTHLTELCALLPTAAIQAFAGDVWNTNDGTPGEGTPRATASSRTGQAKGADSTNGTNGAGEHSNDKPPFQLGRCHALRFDGEAVQQFYPRWYGHAPRSADRAAGSGDGASRLTGNGSGASGVNDGSGNEVQSNSQTEGNHA
ncbi:DUF2889 domain-containing protein [Paraburkholderia lacunae]|uniref:DUF2889 domain-containing protein n=1 Tax=Paraburkholderia lacunae TaxID=2211104 RepID=A0A370NG98_9BURK|nr:DUF2889 domain-containing protein [Paraburkholderia lacunae]RDK04624.1 hypothetical protein DLM46_01785 [Paraburkholderia lacunae]